MKNLQVFYQKVLKPIYPSALAQLTIKDVTTSPDFTRIGSLQVNDPDEAYWILDRKHILSPAIFAKGVDHHSMTVGDCLVTADFKKGWVCGQVGWIEIN